MKLYYHDSEDMINKLSPGHFYRDSYFAKEVVIEEIDSSISYNEDKLIERWDGTD